MVIITTKGIINKFKEAFDEEAAKIRPSLTGLFSIINHKECSIEFIDKINAVNLSRITSGGKKLTCEICGEYQMIVCRKIFSNPEKVFNEKTIFKMFEKSREKKGCEVFRQKMTRQVRTAVENINEKAMPGLLLDKNQKLIIYSDGKIALNRDFLTD